ncbi:MAG: hypothetical protein ACI9VR_005131 [Cognaticolwellia sp.]|jgi:hypothetical protein
MFWLIACLTPYPIVPGEPPCVRFADEDLDGFGDPTSCLPPTDGVGVENSDDCDDADDTVYPGAEELCDQVDQNCDGSNENDPSQLVLRYEDADGDSYGNINEPADVCEGLEGWVTNDMATDCNDGDPSVHPNAPELCDGKDQNCNQLIDDNPDDGQLFYLDSDADTYGRKQDFTEELCTAPDGYVANPDDCDDENADVNPSQIYFFESSTPKGSWDYNCDGSDEKGYPAYPECDADDNLVVDGFVSGPAECGDFALFADYCFFGTPLGAFDYRTQPCR